MGRDCVIQVVGVVMLTEQVNSTSGGRDRGALVGDSYGPVQWEMAHVRKGILEYIDLDQ